MAPLFQTQFLRSYVPERDAAGAEEEQIVSSGDDDDTSDKSSAPATAATKLSRAQQAQVAQMIGDTMSRLNRLADAVSYYQTARHLETAAAAPQNALPQNH